MHAVRRFLGDDSGVTAIEYCFIAGLIALVIFPVLGVVGPRLSAKFAVISAKLGADPGG